MIDIRPGTDEDIAVLQKIESAAAGVFSDQDLPSHLRTITITAEEHRRALRSGLLLVAVDSSGAVVGFAITELINGNLHLMELDVHPDFHRQGIGSALLEEVMSLATGRGCRSITLTTFLTVPWNAPWYGRHGFRILSSEELDSYLKAIVEEEAAKGLDPSNRVAMCRDVEEMRE